MANTKISALTAATSLTGPEQLPAVQSGGNVSVTPELLGAALVHPGHVAGNWYMPPMGTMVAGTAIGANTMSLVPVFVPRRITISDLGVRVSTLGTGNARLAIYASSATTKKPTGTALGSVTVSTGATGNISATLGTNVSLNAGLYWLGCQLDNGTAVICCFNNNTPFFANLVGLSSITNLFVANGTTYQGYTVSATYASGAPDLTSASFTESSGTIAIVGYKVTSVP